MASRAIDLQTGAMHVNLRGLSAASILLVVLAGCGGSAATVFQEPVSARVIVTDVQVSPDGESVEYISVRIDANTELTIRLVDNIDLAIWGPPHLLSHAGLGKSLGLKIGIT